MIGRVLMDSVSILGSVMISWASRKHKFVALNTAEYIVACDACTEAVWLHKLVYGLFD
jgi:hypothetical protein